MALILSSGKAKAEVGRVARIPALVIPAPVVARVRRKFRREGGEKGAGIILVEELYPVRSNIGSG